MLKFYFRCALMGALIFPELGWSAPPQDVLLHAPLAEVSPATKATVKLTNLHQEIMQNIIYYLPSPALAFLGTTSRAMNGFVMESLPDYWSKNSCKIINKHINLSFMSDQKKENGDVIESRFKKFFKHCQSIDLSGSTFDPKLFQVLPPNIKDLRLRIPGTSMG